MTTRGVGGDGAFPGGPGRTTAPDTFNSLMSGLEERVFGRLPDETWIYPGTATTPPWARSARTSRNGAPGAGKSYCV